MRTRFLIFRRSSAFLLVTAAAIVAAPSSALATTASAEVDGTALQFINGTPANIAFPSTTLGPSDQTVTKAQPFDVSDASGTAAGWNIQATSTTFTAAGHTLASVPVIQTAPTNSGCDALSSCVPATNSLVSYPYVLPSGATAPAATMMYEADANTGMGNQTIIPTWSLTIPSTTWAGGSTNPYTSTWTFTLAPGT
jgi:hypothetical protein